MRLSGSTPAASASSRARASYRSGLRVLEELMTRPFAPSSHRAPAPPAANAIERQLATRPQWNQAVAKKAIAELWPNGISEDLENGQIEQRVGAGDFFGPAARGRRCSDDQIVSTLR